MADLGAFLVDRALPRQDVAERAEAELAEVHKLAEEEEKAHMGGWKDLAVPWVRRLLIIGIGLAIVQRIVKDAHGYIDIQSKLGEGTTFSLYFPLEVNAVVSTSHPQLTALGGNERIIVVDDDSDYMRRVAAHVGTEVEEEAV